MNSTEQNTKTPSTATSVFALLGFLLPTKGTGASMWRSWTLAPLLALAALAFTTAPALAAAPETPTMEVTGRTSTEASLSGVLNPGTSAEPAQSGTYEFIYKKSATECTGGAKSTQGLVLPETQPVSETLTGLEPGGEYTVCLLAENGASETAESAPQTFTLPAETPATREVKEVAASTATFHGELNPLRSGTAGYEFMYNTTRSETGCEGGRTTKLEAEQTGKAIPVSTKVTGLTANTEYTFCVVAVNNAGELAVAPPAKPFKTGLIAAPRVDSESTSAVTSTAAKLEAQVNPNGQTTSYSFEYSTQGQTGAGEKLEGTIVDVPGASLLPGFYEDQEASVPTGTLLAGTTYYYRVVASNATPPATDGMVQEFTTVPTPVTEAPTLITTETATLNGKLTSLNKEVPTEYWFEYAVGTKCASGAEGGAETTHESTLTASGTKAVSAAVAGLQPSATYTVCLVASNSSGSVTSAAVHFGPTHAAAPKIDSESNPVLTPFEATFEATINPNNQETTAYLQYSTSSATNLNGSLSGSPVQVPAAPGTSLGSGYGDVAVTGETGRHLTPGTPYYYQAVAINATGTVYGTVETITAPAAEAPVIESESAPTVTPHEAQLEAVVNPKYQETTCEFEYGTSSTLATHTPVACNPEKLGNGNGGVGASAVITGLTPKVKYYYRVSVTNGTATEKGTIDKFETGTLKAPVIESEGVSAVSQTTATLEAQVNPEYQKTPYTFEYAANEESVLLEGNGTKVAGGELPAGSIATGFEHAASAPVTGLIPNTLYYYRVVAHNATGQAAQIPTVQSFTTPSIAPPAITNEGASIVESEAATLQASIDPNGFGTSYHFEYDTTPYTSATPHGTSLTSKGANTEVNIGAGTSPVPVEVRLTGLEPGTVYYYRVVATNEFSPTGGTPGPNKAITTPSSPPAPIPAAATQPPAPAPAASPSSGAPALIPYTTIAQYEAKESKETTTTTGTGPKPLTKAQELAKALKACKKEKSKSKRQSCEKAAHKKYSTAKKKK